MFGNHDYIACMAEGIDPSRDFETASSYKRGDRHGLPVSRVQSKEMKARLLHRDMSQPQNTNVSMEAKPHHHHNDSSHTPPPALQ